MVLQFIDHLIQARVDEVQMAEMIREVSAEEDKECNASFYVQQHINSLCFYFFSWNRICNCKESWQNDLSNRYISAIKLPF